MSLSNLTYTPLSLVDKLVGPIEPFGETNEDTKRFEALKTYCEIIDRMLFRVATIKNKDKTAHQASIKRAVAYCNKFIQELKDAMEDKQ